MSKKVKSLCRVCFMFVIFEFYLRLTTVLKHCQNNVNRNNYSQNRLKNVTVRSTIICATRQLKLEKHIKAVCYISANERGEWQRQWFRWKLRTIHTSEAEKESWGTVLPAFASTTAVLLISTRMAELIKLLFRTAVLCGVIFKVNLNKLWFYIKNEVTLICAKYGASLTTVFKDTNCKQ